VADKTPPIKDLTNFYSDLAFTPSELKNHLWAAQQLFYSKLSGSRFLDEKKAIGYRKLDKLEINRSEYVEMIDPVTPTGGGGKADFFASNFGAIPIDTHLDDIVKAKIEKIPDQIVVDVIDKFAKIQKQKDKEKILWQREFRNLVNEYTSVLGIPPMKESQSPYTYVKEFSKNNNKDDDNKDESGIGAVDNMLDYIKTQINDGHDLALYESYIYKGDIEIALELGIQHFLINLNKWKSEKWEWFINDLKNFNKACGRWYIDETNGRGTVQYIDPKDLYTSPFKSKNGEDIVFWYHEYFVTFAEFVRQFGQGLNDEQLKEVFELNKIQGGGHKMDYRKSGSAKGSNAFIQVGILSMLTQDADTFSIKYINNNIPTLKKEPLNWKQGKDADKKQIEQRIYNVWYSCYYVPPPGGRLQNNSQADWAWQSQYIFNLKKDIDMYRYGVDMRYAKSSLVIWKDDTRPSFTDRKECFMPFIRTLWHKWQNCIINDKSGVVFSNELIGSILNATDDANKNNAGNPNTPTGGSGTDAGIIAFRQLTQGGMAIGSFKDKQGNTLVNPQTLVVSIDNGMLSKAERYLKQILEAYQVMTTSLAQDNVTQGLGAKPRTAVSGIEASLDASANGIWYLEKPAREFLVMFSERTVQHIFNIVKEKKKYGFKERWEEFKNVIGMANALMLEEIEDIEPENIGITVSLEDVSANKNYIFQLANKMADEKEVSIESIGLVIETAKSNYKYAYVLLMLAAKKKAKEDANKQDLMHQQSLELENVKLKTAMTLIQGKTQGKDQNIKTQGQIDAMIDEKLAQLKHDSMADLKDKTRDNKIQLDNNKSNLNIQAPN
jgi:hypothetical protein